MLAGSSAPSVALGKDQAERQKCCAAWKTWWKDQGDKIDLAGALTQRQLGYTLLILPNASQIVEIDASGKERWQLTGCVSLSMPRCCRATAF